MRTNFIKFFGCMLLLTLGVVTCKDPKDPVKPNPPVVEDPYTPVTEGGVFLPILMNKPDMDKVIEAETKRGGKLKEKHTPESKGYVLYKFEYQEMDIKEVEYRIDAKTEELQQVIMTFPKKDLTLSKCLTLGNKHGFNENHILAKKYSCLAREKDALFIMAHNTKEGLTKITFRQFGKQPEPFATISQLPSKDYKVMLENKAYGHSKIKAIEKTAGNIFEREDEMDSGKHKGKIRYALYSLKQEERPMTHRGYFFDWYDDTPGYKLGLCHEIIFCYVEPSLGYYIDDIWKVLIPTQEFYALCKKEGYEWEMSIGYGDLFINEKENMVMAVRRVQLNDISPDEILAINIFRTNDSTSKSLREKDTDLHPEVIKANGKLIRNQSAQAMSMPIK